MHKENKIIYLVRHGQSEGNISRTFQLSDSPLSDLGREQAEKIAERVAKLEFDSLIVSPLLRTKETAEFITKKTGKEPEFNDLFIERVKPSHLYGKAFDDGEVQELWKDWERGLYTPGFRAEDGENFDDLMMRSSKALDFLKEHQSQKIVLVGHGYFLKTILSKIVFGDTLSPEAFRSFQTRVVMENTGLSVIKYEKNWEGENIWRLRIFNDHSHLA